jgi:hypothetical protein
MKSSLDYLNDHLCILNESEPRARSPGGSPGNIREWYAVREASETEVATLVGRPVTSVESEEGLYVDEDGNVYQLAEKGETKPIAVEPLSGTEKTELAVLVEASLKGRQSNGQSGVAKRLLKKNRGGGRKRAMQASGSAPQSLNPETTTSAQRKADAASKAPVQLNLRQKLAEVRRRIGYVQKRGHNERFNYSYVTAADIAGSVGDILAELGVVVIPSLEEISYEPAAGRGEAARMARVIMAYTFADVDSGEEVVATAAGQGLDAGDKAAYKAMTGALKYALLQTFLLATCDDPEDERLDARFSKSSSGRVINAEQVRDLEKRIQDTGTDLERLLAYYKVASLSEMTEFAYRVAVKVLNRKLAKQGNQDTAHAQD